MNILSNVSETALITLKARVIETQKKNPVLSDKKAVEIFQALLTKLPEEYKTRILNRNFPHALTSYIALRAKKFDYYSRQFLKENPNGLIVSLGCGFDTRYWRIMVNKLQYIEIDLPELIEYKKLVLKNNLNYIMLGTSVLDDDWMDKILEIQNKNVLFLAEGLFMYLPEKSIIHIFKKLAMLFNDSQIVFEVVHKKYTRGLMKKIVESKMKRQLRSSAGSSYNYGVKNAQEIESYSNNIKVMEEWSFVEDRLVKPSFLKVFRSFKSITRSQWTIKASIG